MNPLSILHSDLSNDLKLEDLPSPIKVPYFSSQETTKFDWETKWLKGSFPFIIKPFNL